MKIVLDRNENVNGANRFWRQSVIDVAFTAYMLAKAKHPLLDLYKDASFYWRHSHRDQTEIGFTHIKGQSLYASVAIVTACSTGDQKIADTLSSIINLSEKEIEEYLEKNFPEFLVLFDMVNNQPHLSDKQAVFQLTMGTVHAWVSMNNIANENKE